MVDEALTVSKHERAEVTYVLSPITYGPPLILLDLHVLRYRVSGVVL